MNHANSYILILGIAGWIMSAGTPDVLTKPGTDAVAESRLRVLGPPELYARGIASAASTDVKVTFSPDGSRMLWGCIGRTGGPGGWDIFESTKGDAGWGAPRPVAFNSAANDFDPFFTPDGSGVYFFSNRPGGFGKDDLWFAPFDAQAGAYGEPKNLGAGVNSAGGEWAPVVSPDGTRLLFASDGRGGAGKHDLFIATKGSDGTWGNAKNLGAAVNTAEEDFDATFLHDRGTLILSCGNLDGPDVGLYVVYDRGRGFQERTRLPVDVNAPGSWTFGPSIHPREPGFLYFTSKRSGGEGGMDIYRIRYVLEERSKQHGSRSEAK